jgi:uncharacterized protein YbjT (DUF2867 family)
METGATILVTGATGQQGGAVARELLGAGHRVKAMTRNPGGDGAKELAALGAEVVQGDLNDVASLERAVEGAWGVFAVQNTWEAGIDGEEEQGKRLAEISRERGVHHLVYTSVGSADRETGIPHFDNKWRIEEAIRGLEFPSYTILRPVFFMENWLAPWFRPAIDEGTVAIGIRPDTQLQMIAVDDIGRYGRVAFEKSEEFNGRAIDIAGDELTMPEVADAIGRASGRTLSFFQVPIEQVREFSDDFAIMLEWFDRVGYDADISGNAGEYGVSPTTFDAWAAQVSW